MELRGFEPLTSCMPCRRKAELSYSPVKRVVIVSGFRWCRFELDDRCVCPQSLEFVVALDPGAAHSVATWQRILEIDLEFFRVWEWTNVEATREDG